jgi:hypothetical protein
MLMREQASSEHDRDRCRPTEHAHMRRTKHRFIADQALVALWGLSAAAPAWFLDLPGAAMSTPSAGRAAR